MRSSSAPDTGASSPGTNDAGPDVAPGVGLARFERTRRSPMSGRGDVLVMYALTPTAASCATLRADSSGRHVARELLALDSRDSYLEVPFRPENRPRTSRSTRMGRY